MFTKALGLIFNRWTLLALLVLALLLVIWIIGPLIAIAEARPLDSEQTRWITVVAVLVATALLVGWSRWRARHGNAQVVQQLGAVPAGADKKAESADMAAVRERFTGALQVLRNARFGAAASGTGLWHRLSQRLGGRYLYQMPWYLIIGAPGTGKTTALRNAGLQFPLAARMGEQAVRGVGGTRNCDWWFTDRAVLIDTAGRFTTQDSDQANDKATWSGFLNLLKRSRPRQPLNGVLVAVAASDLITKGAGERHGLALTVRARVQELHEQLGVRLPIYLLITKCDLMAGFAETFAALDKDQRATPWGFTFPLEGHDGGAFQSALTSEFDSLLQRLSIGTIDRLQAESDPQRRVRIYSFANQFANLRAPLVDLVQQVFAPSPFERDPLLRGVYFVSGTQEGSPIDRVLGAVGRRYQLERAMLPPQRASGRSYFLERLLTDVVFAEQGLAATNRRWERQRSALALAGYVALGVLGISVMAAWTWSWRNNRAYIDAVAARVDGVRRQVQETPNRATPDLAPMLGALEATRALAVAGDAEASVPWSLSFGLYQGRKLDSAAQAAYERMLVDAVLPRLALRVEEELRAVEQPESHYEALKAYLMMYDPSHFDAASLKSHIEADWDARLGRSLSAEQRESLSRHLDALLAQGAAVSPLPQDKALIESTRLRLAAVSLPQRVYNRLRQTGLGGQFPEFTVAQAGGGNAQVVFTRASGLPLTRGVSGLFTYKGYHQGFQSVVDKAAKQLADEQGWVLGIAPAKGGEAMLAGATGRLVDDVRRLYLTEYRDTWKAFIADVRLGPIGSISQALERTRFLAAPDTPLLPLLRAMSRETTLLAGQGLLGGLTSKAQSTTEIIKGKVLGAIDAKPVTKGAPSERIESIVDDEFAGLRRLVTAPEGGKAPIEGVIARLGELQVHLTAVEATLKGGGAPQPSPLPNQLKAEAANSPDPVRSMLDNLGATSAKVGLMQLRESLSREVKAQIGDFCSQAITGRYPFDGTSPRDVTPADFATLFGPGGKFDQMQQRLSPYIDTSTRTWSFRAVDGTPLGTDVGTLPQFQRAAAIRETFFSGGALSTRLEFKPVEMDIQLREFTLDVDGQIVRYNHGPQIPQPVSWPGPRGTGVVRVMVQPAGSTGMVSDGPWALFRLFDRVSVQPGAAPEKFRATFDIDGRKAVFDVTAASVRHPFRMNELRSFTCPNGL